MVTLVNAEVSTATYRRLLQAELSEVETLMLSIPSHTPAAVRHAVSTVIRGGGKRLRPAVALLMAHIHGANVQSALFAAAAIEMLHTATLIHDDLIDGGTLRRGMETLNVTWPAAATVLVGDLLFSHAADLATRSENIILVRRFAETLGVICSGEIDQLFNGRGVVPSETIYYQRIYAKTASLFGLASESGPILAGDTLECRTSARAFGMALGQAFQITDDVLDFMGDRTLLGKPVGSDLRQGLITLPALHYLAAHPEDPRFASILTQTASDADIDSLVKNLRHSDAADWAMARAETHMSEAQQILESYPASIYRDALQEIVAFSVERRF